jgi:hypothetical protein
MTLEELKEKHSQFPVKYEPLQNCPVCRGKGEFLNAKREQHLCACTCVGGPDKVRAIMVQTLQDSLESTLGKFLGRKRR